MVTKAPLRGFRWLEFQNSLSAVIELQTGELECLGFTLKLCEVWFKKGSSLRHAQINYDIPPTS